MSDAKRTKNYIVYKLRKNYREGKLDTSQVARLKAIGFDFDGAVFNASKDSLAVQYPAIAEEWDKERNGKRDNRGCNQPTAKKVRCAETGNQFVSLSDAARAVGLRNGASVRRAIDRGGTAGGYHWEYLDEKKEVRTDDHHQADGRAE